MNVISVVMSLAPLTIRNVQSVRRGLMKSEKLNIEVTLSSENSCYLGIKDYIIYVEVSQATENKPLVSFWKKGLNDDRAVTVSH